MTLEAISQSIDLGSGEQVIIETGILAKQADGSAIVRIGDTVILATVCSATEMREGQSFFPLSVDYQEKFAATGKIPGGFLKREGRLSDYEILTCRIVDRALRPLFPDGYLFDTQVIISLISADKDVMPDAYAALAASTALTLSNIPFAGPISEVRVGRVNGEFILNPKRSELEQADMDIVIGATIKDVTMVEGEMKEVSEEDLIAAIKLGHDAIKKQCEAQLALAKAIGGVEKREFVLEEYENEAVKKQVVDFAKDKIYAIASNASDKAARKKTFKQLKADLIEHLGEFEEEHDEKMSYAKSVYEKLNKEVVRAMILNDKKRLDGRGLTDVRPLWIKTDYLPTPHGSAVFTRGETQSLTTVTLGSKHDEQLIDNALENRYNNFYLHYNFPAFSVGEVRPMRGPGRREIGHGNLAMRSIKQVLPPHEECPYTIRIVSDILESNGSSSMATVCAGSLALMDAGIKIKGGVSGIAMGMISDEDGNHAILSDILGDEDHIGDMDFKVTGTEKGICACQMDIKIDGLPYELLEEALQQAKEGRLHILHKMNETMSEPRADYKEHVPRIESFVIPEEFIGAIIGPGGKNIQELQKNTETTISIESKDADKMGTVTIFGDNAQGVRDAIAFINGIAAKPDVGETYEATVKAIQSYGAFVEFMPGKEGLLHISEISWKRLETMDDVFEIGDKIKVKLMSVDERSGKFKLSRKAIMPKPEKGNS